MRVRHFNLPPLPGTYALLLLSSSHRSVLIGNLGTLRIKPGFYVYIGSAFGPGGLKARIGHHRKDSGRPHWHLDYLRRYLGLDEIWYTCDPEHREHQWVTILSQNRKAAVPLAGFGSSDCHCESHLYYFSSRPSGKYFRRKIHSRFDNHGRIYLV
jgi:Uri superfamily endonuclease